MTKQQMSKEEIEARRRFRDDFFLYASRALKIRTKDGKVAPFVLNPAQQYIHERLQKQIKETGKVRALILKGRQQGCSTYTEGRFYWRVTHRRGVRAFILTHEQEATNNLFEMATRYHEHCPEALKPKADANNAKELYFGGLDSGYKVGTAGSKGTGRSQTVQYFHGSEVAFWPNAETHATGVMQAVPDTPNTEVILESTANGIGNYFYEMWQNAVNGRSDYEAIFVPWFWQPEYAKPVDSDFSMTASETDYAQAYGLAPAQVKWMRSKIAEFGGDEAQFHQEYPATAALAFQTSSERSLIGHEIVTAARAENTVGKTGQAIGGLDLARFGDDNSAFIVRHARRAHSSRVWHGKDTMEMAGIAVKLIAEHDLAKLFIDVGGLGAGVVDRLRELGHGGKIVAVNFGSKATDGERYKNKRAECWGLMRDWLNEPPVSIPDDDGLHGDLVGPQYKYDSNQRLQLESKEDMKKRGIKSPDVADALALTFAEPIGYNAARVYRPSTRWIT